LCVSHLHVWRELVGFSIVFQNSFQYDDGWTHLNRFEAKVGHFAVYPSKILTKTMQFHKEIHDEHLCPLFGLFEDELFLIPSSSSHQRQSRIMHPKNDHITLLASIPSSFSSLLPAFPFTWSILAIAAPQEREVLSGCFFIDGMVACTIPQLLRLIAACNCFSFPAPICFWNIHIADPNVNSKANLAEFLEAIGCEAAMAFLAMGGFIEFTGSQRTFPVGALRPSRR
jgi:hypothetical protein